MGLALLEQHDRVDKVCLIWPLVDLSSSLFPKTSDVSMQPLPLSEKRGPLCLTDDSGTEALISPYIFKEEKYRVVFNPKEYTAMIKLYS